MNTKTKKITRRSREDTLDFLLPGSAVDCPQTIVFPQHPGIFI